MKVEDLKKFAVLGAGTMGHGIAQLAAVSGYTVALRDISQEILEKAMGNIKWSLGRLVKRGRLSEEDLKATLSRITTTLDLKEAVGDADIVIEAIPENLNLKLRVFREVDAAAPKGAILASNTSSLSITEIAEAVEDPGRFVGMHFFNPPALMRLVEVVAGEETSKETVEAVLGFAKKLGKTPVLVKKDSPGFIVNRVLIPYLNEACKIVERGEFKALEIDSAMQFKARFPMGPFLLSDYIGIDIVYEILKVFEEKLGPYYKPSASIERLFKEKKLGRKTEEGFYSYKEGRPQVPEDAGAGFDINRLLAPMINEAAKLVSEDVAEIEAVDTAMKLGANLPEGPFEAARRIGVEKLVGVLRELEERDGEGYTPSPFLSSLQQ